MKITTAKVKKELKKNFGWLNLEYEPTKIMVNELISDTLKVVNKILIEQKKY